MAQSVEQFTEAYTKLLVASWSDESFAQRLRTTPEAVAREVGLEIPEGTTVAVVEPTEPGNQDLAEYHRQFEEGAQAGHVDLIVPGAPMVDMQNLTENELAEVAGGVYCCCCCPCCCCG